MAAEIKGVFEDNLEQLVKDAKLFVVGAGGIGCELLKNLVLTGFKNIDIVRIPYSNNIHIYNVFL